MQTFSANAPERLPPKTVKSCEKTQTWRPSISAVAGDDAVAGNAFLFHPEVGAAMGLELVELDERAGVEQELDPLAGGHFARLALFL